MTITVTKTDFEGLFVIQSSKFIDSRGEFIKPWIASDLKKVFGEASEFYISSSVKGVFRGLHYQVGKYAQKKYVICLSGEIEDIALDTRESSKTYGKYFKFDLREMSGIGLIIPEGFAHGFFAKRDSTVLCVCSSPYSFENELGINYKSIPEFDCYKDVIVSNKDMGLAVWKP